MSKCITCRHWDWKSLNEDLSYIVEVENHWGQCRCKAPVPIVLVNTGEGMSTSRTNTFWPETTADEYCGEHDEDEDRVAEMQNGGVLDIDEIIESDTELDVDPVEDDLDCIPPEMRESIRKRDIAFEKIVLEDDAKRNG